VLWEQGKFPVERLMTFSDVDRSDDAAHDAEAGNVIKPVLRIGAAT
jgi:aryl-alcohol dehydrogenase